MQREFPIIRYKNRHGSRNEFTQAEVQKLMKSGDQNSDIEQKLDEVHEQIGFHCEKIENQP